MAFHESAFARNWKKLVATNKRERGRKKQGVLKSASLYRRRRGKKSFA
jgi:hypothetical protein